MNIVITPSSPIPIYRQLYEQICILILKGELKSGESLPSIRTLARELSVSVITVKKAWEALEASGFIITVSTKGSYVASLTEGDIARLKEEIIKEELSPIVEKLKAFKASREDIERIIDVIW
ncbi:MAG: GntR family transcriptional regulator [Eubacteriaceae bacterium]|nr:GntR family transcriptional regulator [Eubacteriaceae bacterium]